MDFVLHRMDMVKYREHLLHHRMTFMMLHHLGKIANLDTGGLFYTALGRRLLPRYEFHKGRLAGAVFSHQAYLILLADMEIDSVQQDKTAIGYCNITDGDHSSAGTLFRQSRMENSNKP